MPLTNPIQCATFLSKVNSRCVKTSGTALGGNGAIMKAWGEESLQFLRERHDPLWRTFSARTWAIGFLMLLYLIGVLHWMNIFDFAIFHAKDWALVMKYHSVLRDAFARLEIPYLMTLKGHYTDRFLALPEAPLSPQYFLLAWLDDKTFNVLNILLLYSLSFIGLLLLKKEWNLSALPFTFLYMLFSFNGYIVSRVTVGHTMWYGYFFLPYFHLLVLRMTQGPFPERSRIMLILVLFLILLQGSFLMYTWCMLYLALIALFNPALWRPVLYVGVGSMLTALFRFLPGAVTFQKYNLDVVGGYPSLTFLVDGLTVIRDFREKYRCGAYGLGWWEFDCYVGLTGLGLILYFCFLTRPRDKSMGIPVRFRALDLPNLLMVILCFGEIYSFACQWPIPLISAQRVPARFIIVPITMLALLAALRMEDFLARDKPSYEARLLLILCLFMMAWGLYVHAEAWRIYDADLFFLRENMYGSGPGYVVPPDMESPNILRYVRAVQISAAMSCCAVIFFAYRFLKARRATVPG